MVHPRVVRLVYASKPVMLGAELVPPLQSAIPLLNPASSKLTKKLSTLASVKAQFVKQLLNWLQFILLSNKLAGIVAKLVQFSNARKNPNVETAVLLSNRFAGIAVKLVQPLNVSLNA